jgi:Uma2 family endonuclease
MPGEPALRPDAAVPNDSAVEEAYRTAPEGVDCEILGGFLLMGPRPRTRHGRVATRLAQRLKPFGDPDGDDPGGWTILFEPELHLGPRPDKLHPDLAGWSVARMAEIPDAPEITLAPDWVCEVLSGSTEKTDRALKMPIYERERVAAVWLVTPEDQILEVFALERGRLRPVAVHRGDASVRAVPFDAREIPLARLWSMRAG